MARRAVSHVSVGVHAKDHKPDAPSLSRTASWYCHVGWEYNLTRLNWMSLSWSAGFAFGPAFHQHVERCGLVCCGLPRTGQKIRDHILRTRKSHGQRKFQTSHPKVMYAMWSVPSVASVSTLRASYLYCAPDSLRDMNATGRGLSSFLCHCNRTAPTAF